MSNLLDCVERADRARLFPILAETSKEGRTLSIFLATLECVRELRTTLLGQLGQRVGTTTKLRTYTEVEFKCARNEQSLGRPDGLLILETGGRRWTALVEAKVGKSEISQEQLERYLDLAKQNKINAVITISNQFSAVPHHHPVRVNASKYRSIELYHFSWMQILTEAELLSINSSVLDDDQSFILNEFRRFISHESAGVQGFTQMPSEWPELISKVQAGSKIQKNGEASAVAEAWQQETRDLCLILSRQLGQRVTQRMSRAAVADPEVRFQEDLNALCTDQALSLSMGVPNAAAPVDVRADLRGRSIRVSMRIRAPEDRVSSRARMNWLLRQIPVEADNSNLHVRCIWPKTSAATSFKIQELREDSSRIEDGKGKLKVVGFEIVSVSDLGRRFDQRRNFIDDLQRAVPAFYENVGQYLRAWQPAAPKIPETRAQPEDVSPAAISETAEASSLQ